MHHLHSFEKSEFHSCITLSATSGMFYVKRSLFRLKAKIPGHMTNLPRKHLKRTFIAGSDGDYIPRRWQSFWCVGGVGFGERKAQGGEQGGTAKHVPKKPPVTHVGHVKPHDNISLFKVIYLSSKLKALYLQFLHQVITIYKLLVHQIGGLYGSLKGNKQNMYNLNLREKNITKMHDSKDRTVAFTL